MRNCNKIIFILVCNLVFTFSMSFAAPAPYKKNVLILPFENPPGWLGDNNPGLLAADLLRAKIANDRNIILLNTISSVNFKTKQGFLKNKLPAQIVATGRILKFISVIPDSLEAEGNPTVEVKIEFQIKDGHTTRILDTKIFQKKLTVINNLLSSNDPLDPLAIEFANTPMSNFLDQMTEKWVPHFRNYLNSIALAGQIIDVEQGDMIIINLGRRNGVKIRDDFTVYEVLKNFKSGNDKINLGARYTQLGVIRVKVVQDEFSEGVIVAGENFSAGNLIRSKLIKPAYFSVREPDSIQSTEVFKPEPVLRPISSGQSIRVRRIPFYSFDFFSLMGLSLEY